MKKRALVWSLFGLAFLVNPQLVACSSSGDDEDFTYDEQDMKAAILGDWQGSVQVDGQSVAFTLKLEQASAKSTTQSIRAPGLTPQCGSRSFVKPAAACASISTMPLLGQLRSDAAELSGPVTGQLMASRILESAELRFELENGRTFNGTLKMQTLSDGSVTGSEPLGTFSLARQ